MRPFCTRFSTLATLVACACLSSSELRAEEAQAAAAEAMNEELRFIEALVTANMPDLAEPVIDAAKKKWPKLGPKLKVLELQGDLRLGKFADVQKVINGIKDKKSSEYWALNLSMADAYYARGQLPECRKIYKAFFAAVPNPGEDLVDFYVESGFKWAQMCVNERQYDEAVKMYGELLSKPLPEERWCAVAMENVDLLIRLASEATDAKQAKKRDEYLTRATALVDKLLWKNELILVFGKAVAMKAHIELLRGNLEKAQGLVTDYMPQLAEIHKSLIEQDPDGRNGYVRMSPMPECRYLLASVMWKGVQEEAKKAKADEDFIKDSLFGARKGSKRNGSGAYNHAINVFVKYPESKWASNAGELAESIAKFVKTRYNREIKTNISADQMKKVRRLQFENADENFRNGDYAKAVKSYEDILGQFPEAEESIGALSNLAESWLNLWQVEKDAKKKLPLRLSADAVEGYLAERFSGLKESFISPAGDAVLRLAAKERDLGALARSQQLYEAFFDCYPTHYNAAQTALTLGSRAYKAEDWEGAIRYYGRVANTYTNSTYYANALSFLAVCNGKIGNTAEQEKWLRLFANTTKKPLERTTAQLRLAQMQQRRGFAAFAAAAETNDADVATALRKDAYRGVAGAIRDFRASSDFITKTLEDKSLPKADREKLLVQRAQAICLEGDSWQRMMWPEDKVPVFRAQAVKAYEKYLALYPKGEYAPQLLVKIGTIFTAEKNMEKSQDAFARLQKNFPESDEAKNSVPRLAKTLIEMGLRAEGVKQYRQMLETPGGKYSAGQFLAAGDALLDAKEWDVSRESYGRAIELAKGQKNEASVTALAQIGRAYTFVGERRYAEAHETLESFIEKNAKSALVVQAYEMLVSVASEEGRTEKDDDLRRKFFNQAVGSLKKLRAYKKSRAEQDLLDLQSGDILVNKMQAEESMGLSEQAKETCGLAVVTFQTFLMAHEPTPEHPAKDMTAAQLANLERCYSTVLPLMAKLGKDQAAKLLEYGEVYQELFPDGKNKTAVQNAINQAKAEL